MIDILIAIDLRSKGDGKTCGRCRTKLINVVAEGSRSNGSNTERVLLSRPDPIRSRIEEQSLREDVEHHLHFLKQVVPIHFHFCHE